MRRGGGGSKEGSESEGGRDGRRERVLFFHWSGKQSHSLNSCHYLSFPGKGSTAFILMSVYS